MKSVAMFNNKGGVGKTTLTCNLASFIANTTKLRVLVVDCDPQCNSTQLIMGVEAASELYLDGYTGGQSTIKDVLQPIEDGDSYINTDLNLLRSDKNRFTIDLLPGHPAFAITEDRLGMAWGGLRAMDKQGFRQTNWNTHLTRYLAGHYDLVFFDLGPSLGSINRSVLMGCQTFLTPLGSDIFSIIGVKNIGQWLSTWIGQYRHSWNGLSPQEKQDLAEKYGIPENPAICDGFIGYTVQQYITKSYGKERRATKAYEMVIGNVNVEIEAALSAYYNDALKEDKNRAKLGDVPHLYSLVPLAQKRAVPIHGLRSEDGLVGSQYSAVRDFQATIAPIARRLLVNLGFGEEPAK